MVENFISEIYIKAFYAVFNETLNISSVQVQRNKTDFEGDFTCVNFPHLRLSKKSPEVTGEMLGAWMLENVKEIKAFNVIKGFLNIVLSDNYWLNLFQEQCSGSNFEFAPEGKKVMVEYSSPNTNKPLHLGHIRNNFLGFAVANILKARGYDVVKTQIINDRGIHICKSMLAWQKWGENSTPESSGMKGDHFVGKYYVEFDKHYKVEMEVLMNEGKTKEEAMQLAPLFIEAQEMLRKWEDNDAEVVKLWSTMNQWVYDGFENTYKNMGVDFEVLYYESDTYKLGKDIVEVGLQKGVFYKREDGSVWCDLTEDGLDEKLVLRKDGTAVYMTQDIGTAIKRYEDYKINGIIYTVGNEQEYHFKVLFLILKKLGYDFYEGLYHLSYGMVDLPNGRMKTREGTVVDADDLMQEMVETAKAANEEKGKLEGLTSEEIEDVNFKVGMSALKYFILKVDPRKGMIFNPEESIDFNGNTGPFILFNYVRTKSILRKVSDYTPEINYTGVSLNKQEKDLMIKVLEYKATIDLAAREYSPSVVANYVYDIAKSYSQYYAATQILKEEDELTRSFRLYLTQITGDTIKRGFNLLGIQLPERM